MPTIHDFDGLKLCMYADDHAPPHFHILGPELHLRVALGSMEFMEPKRARKTLSKAVLAALDWAHSNRALLLERWSELNERD